MFKTRIFYSKSCFIFKHVFCLYNKWSWTIWLAPYSRNNEQRAEKRLSAASSRGSGSFNLTRTLGDVNCMLNCTEQTQTLPNLMLSLILLTPHANQRDPTRSLQRKLSLSAGTKGGERDGAKTNGREGVGDGKKKQEVRGRDWERERHSTSVNPKKLS